MSTLAKIKKEIALNLSKVLSRKVEPKDLVVTPNQDMGDLGYPLFALAKELNKKAVDIARDAEERYPKGGAARAKATGPYLNFIIDGSKLAKSVLKEIHKEKNDYGKSKVGKNEKVVLEFSNVNTHKEYHVGHLRNICYGDSVTRILNAAGFKAVPISYVNDFGIHVAKTLWNYKSFENELGKKLTDLPIEERGFLLGKMYVSAAAKEKENPEAAAAIGTVKQNIESKKGQEYELWQETRKWSIAHFDSIYKDLKVSFNDTLYENEFVDKGKQVVENLLSKGVLKKSEGAIIADFKEYGLEVLVVIRSNGTATYCVADLALAKEKHKRFKPKKSIYLVDVRQSLYFKQLFKILELSGLKEEKIHLSYDFVKLPSGMMSSRTGNVITYKELKEEVLKKSFEETAKRHEDWTKEKIEDNAKKIGLGAVKFEMLKVEAQSVITFDIDKALSLEGFTSAYIQYAYARIKSIFRKIKNEELRIKNFKTEKLTDPKEKELLKKLAYYPEIVEKAAKAYNPSEIAKYAYELAQNLNDYYHAVPVLAAEEAEKNARLGLLGAVAQTIENALKLLGIETVEEM
jgi:arginyl-tRNA synthetase